MDWQTFRTGFEAWGSRPILSEIRSAGAQGPSSESSRDGLLDALHHLSPVDRRRKMSDWLTAQCAAVLGHSDDRELERQRGFFDLGMDSLMAVELRRRLQLVLGKRISPSITFDHPHIETLPDHFLNELRLPNEASEGQSQS